MKEYKGYLVSEFGEVFNKFGKKLKFRSGWHDYLRVAIQENGIREDISVHRLVGKLYIPNPENKPEVNHKDGNKQNNFVSNLEWNTRKENNQHAYDTGLNYYGEDSVNSKLTNKQVEEIRKKYIPWEYSSVKLAKEYGVCHGSILRIVKHKQFRIKN